MKHCASFILIPPGLDRMGRYLSRGKLSKKKRTFSLKFGSSVIFQSQEAALLNIKSPSNTFTDLALAEVIFFLSKTPIKKN